MKKYEKVAAELRDRIRRLPPGSVLETRAELAGQFGVAGNTIASALGILRAEGWIETAQGARTVTLAPTGGGLTLEQRIARLEGRVDSIERRIR